MATSLVLPCEDAAKTTEHVFFKVEICSSSAEACSTEYKDTQTRLQCAIVGLSHRGTADHRCTGQQMPQEIEDNAPNAVVKENARNIRATMAMGLGQ